MAMYQRKQGSKTLPHETNRQLFRRVAARILPAILLLTACAWGQMHRYPVPPTPADSEQSQTAPKPRSPKTPSRNPVELERTGRELADLASTIPDDVQQVNKGLLPKEMSEKLKRIEKLAKELRGEIGH
jgi:hypothetical protein